MRDGPQARRQLAAHLRALYEKRGATLGELGRGGRRTQRGPVPGACWSRPVARHAPPSKRNGSALQRDATERQKLALSLRARYEAGATVPDLAEECSYSVGTVYRLLHQAGTRMRPKHNHGPARTPRKRS